MSATLSRPDSATELRDIYERYKLIALSASAALIMDQRDAGLAPAVEALLVDARAARIRAPRLERELTACIDATARLRPLAAGSASDSDVDDVRGSHRRLRRAIWSVIPCEYVPCCAGGRASHDR